MKSFLTQTILSLQGDTEDEIVGLAEIGLLEQASGGGTVDVHRIRGIHSAFNGKEVVYIAIGS